jgi:hypothetical protein
MDYKYNNISVKLLNLILKKLNDKKIIRNPKVNVYNVDKIISVNTRMCRYVGDINNTKLKKHLHVKFTSPDENGTICLSILRIICIK